MHFRFDIVNSMKIILGTILLAVSHVINVHAFVIPSLSSSLKALGGRDASFSGSPDGDFAGAESSDEIDKRSRFRLPVRRALWDRFVARSPQVGTTGVPVPSGTDSIDLETITGTGPASTSAVDNLSTTIPSTLVTDTSTATGFAVDPPAATATETESTVTVTQTSILIVTATVGPVPSDVPNAQNVAFGGTVGEANVSAAPTGGAVTTIVGGSDAFGGVVGAIIVSATDSAPIPATTTLDSSTPDFFGGVTGFVPATQATSTAQAGYNKRDATNIRGYLLDSGTKT